MITRTADSLQVSGNVNMTNVSLLLKEGLMQQKNHSSDEVLNVDFSQLDKVDSSAVSLMLAWLREAQRNKIKLRFTNVPDNLMSLTKLYGVADLLSLNAA
ncbi:MAG: STAS domain-containing protein [Gallionellaceae bacterium]